MTCKCFALVWNLSAFYLWRHTQTWLLWGSWHHTMVVVGRGPWSSPASTSLLKQSHPEAAAQDCASHPRRETMPLLWVPVLSHSHRKKVFLDVQRERRVSPFVPITSCPVSGHHREDPGSVLFAPSLQAFVDIDEILLSLLFSGLDSPSSLNLSS